MEARDGSARSAEARTEVGMFANAAPASSPCGSVRGADGSSGGDGIASEAGSAASSEAVADGIADTDEGGNGSVIVTGLGATAVVMTITFTMTNRDGVIDDPVRVRDDLDRGNGIRNGRIDDAVHDGAKRRVGRRSRSRGRGGRRHRRDAERRWRGVRLRSGRERAAP